MVHPHFLSFVICVCAELQIREDYDWCLLRKDYDWCLLRLLLCGFLVLISLGYDIIVSMSCLKSAFSLKRSRKFQPEDRLFSLSSVTSPAVEEHVVGRDDGRSDFGPGRSKGGGTPANGQGKPKKGRTAPRDVKRVRPSEQEIDDEDDPDLSLR
eukprot:TRINITY_DN34069_c0_g3_i1.p1 TRINITY_DN34069_c0_g3~~TRINITY_DN34069_c0_g3_i1.p1  ORF type:complete len:154 (-),score=27.84 TRINITY_DN34069_c0_g3_i1:762-1223(-)